MPTLLERAAELAKEDFTTLPIIDLTNATSPDPELRKALAMEIQHAALTAGFFYVKNHSIPSSLITRTLTQSSTFFSLPASIKQKLSISNSDNFRGYMGLLSENTDAESGNEGDLHEALNYGLEEGLVMDGTVKDVIEKNSVYATEKAKAEKERSGPNTELVPKVGKEDGNAILDAAFAQSESESQTQIQVQGDTQYTHGLGSGSTLPMPGNVEGLGLGEEVVDGHAVGEKEKEKKEEKKSLTHGGNQWLTKEEWEGAEEFKKTVLEFYTEVLGLGYRLYPLLALALELPEDFFADKTLNPAVIQRLLHYPPLNGEKADAKRPGIGEHTDYELITILLQDRVGGLEVRNLAGEWIKAESIEGCFVVNFGDQLARWTNDVIRSTRHRAVPPPAFTARYSIPAFFGCDHDVPLVPIPTCVSEDRPSKYEVVTAGQYVQSRLEETYTVESKE